jgi:RHS repeat-associated protein
LAETAVTLTTQWQQFTVSSTLQNGLTALAMQIGGGGSIKGGQVYDVWGPELGPASGGTVTNILPSSEQVTGPSWVVENGMVTSSSGAAPDGTSTAATVTANSGSTDTYLVDYVQNPSQYSGKTVTASVYLRVGSGTQKLNLYLVNKGSSGFTIPGSAAVTLTTSWQRFDVTATDQAGLTTAYLQIGGGYSLTSGQSILVWGAQMVTSSSQGGYVETQNTTTVTGTSQTLAANGLNEVYSYDAFGNIQEAGNYSFIQAYTSSNQLSGWRYDQAGNVLADAMGNGYVYDAEGKIKSGAGVTYYYTPDGQRVEKSGTSLIDTVYFGGRPIARLFSGGLWTDLVYGASGLLLEVPGTQTGSPTYRMTDHLGSLVGTLSSAGAVVSSEDLAPFGEIFAGGSADPFVFTGKERDSESGNDYFGARYYSSNMGRFLSPDNGVDQDTENPQSWNLYSYVQNNPLTKTDDDGRSVQICDINGNCQTVSDETYNAAQQASNSALNGPSLSSLQNSGSGSGTLTSTSTDANGNTTTTAVGSVQWTPDNPGIQGPGAIQAFGQIGNQGMAAVNFFGQQMALNVVGGLAGAGVGMAFDAFKASAAIGEILAKAGSAVGNTSIQVASREAAEQAAKQWVGEGAREIVDRGTGKVVGEISADGTKVARYTSADTKGYINLESKTTGSNLHVRW